MAASSVRQYRYALGFKVDGAPIPDPSAFNGTTADQDVSAVRDTTGLLHRDMVAQKLILEMGYRAITWDMAKTILQSLNKAQFEFTFPDPNTGEERTITAYTGNRAWPTVWLPEGAQPAGWYTDLSFTVIEY